MRAIDRVVEPETLGNLLVGRILEHALAAADEHRYVGHADVEALEQHFGLAIALDVDVGVRMPIAVEKLACAKRRRGVRGSQAARRRRRRW